MTDISHALKAKTDQLNAEDLVDRSIVITVGDVTVRRGKEQPVSIFFDGDDGKPYKPCKSMLRVIANVWTKDSAAWKGKSMKLFCDPEIRYGGLKVGGIRISHISGIDSDRTIMLTETRGNRKPYVVKPLKFDELAERVARTVAGIEAAEPTEAALASINKKAPTFLDQLTKAGRADLHKQVTDAIDALKSSIKPETENATG